MPNQARDKITLINNLPKAGTVLRSKDGLSVRVHHVFNAKKNENKHFFFVNALVDYEGTGWYLIPDETGLKVIFNETTKKTFLKKADPEKIYVDCVTVLGKTPTKTALICEAKCIGEPF